MLSCGIDLHSNNSFIVIIDESDRVVHSKRHANSMNEILEAMAPYQDEISGIAVESTFNWYWLIDGLQAHDYSVHLVNTVTVKQYDGMKHHGDESDARHLAHLLRPGLLPEGHIMPKDRRAMRDLARKFYQRKRAKRNGIVAIKAVAHKLARACYHMLRTGEVFSVGRCFA